VPETGPYRPARAVVGCDAETVGNAVDADEPQTVRLDSPKFFRLSWELGGSLRED
jgi:hypothetical protein